MRCCGNCAYHKVDWGRTDEGFWTAQKQIYCVFEEDRLVHDLDTCPRWTWDHEHETDMGDLE